MTFARFTSIALLGTLISASAAWAHGTERHFDTVINGREGRAPLRTSGGSPAFTLLLIESNSNAMLRAVDENQPSEVRERASRLPVLVQDLRRRSQALAPPQREHAAEVTAAIEENALRIGTAAETADTPSLQREIAELRRHVTSMKGWLRETTRP